MQIDAAHPFRPAADLSRFYVVTPVSNPARFQRRYELYARFAEMCASASVNLITVEEAFGLRDYMVTQAGNERHVQVRTVEELWHKENLINLGIRRAVKLGAREVAWVDCDCRPAAPVRTWFEETWHALQHYEFVQMWEWLTDLSLNHNPIGEPQPGFVANYIKHGAPNYEEFVALKKSEKSPSYPYGKSVFGRPGLAWAANVDALNKVGGLVDYAILGAGDWYMAHGLIGMMAAVVPDIGSGDVSTSDYLRKLYHWQDLCERWIKRDVGYVRGLVYHDWHGRKTLRQYGTRGSILVSNGYDPDKDIKPDSQGLLQLETYEPRQIRLRDQIRAYFASRGEDSTTGGED